MEDVSPGIISATSRFVLLRARVEHRVLLRRSRIIEMMYLRVSAGLKLFLFPISVEGERPHGEHVVPCYIVKVAACTVRAGTMANSIPAIQPHRAMQSHASRLISSALHTGLPEPDELNRKSTHKPGGVVML
jgi:hypothetical protein